MQSRGDRLRAFLTELARLRQEYGFEVGGCKCCGSPWVDDVEGRKRYEDLEWIEEEGVYEVYGYVTGSARRVRVVGGGVDEGGEDGAAVDEAR